MSPLNKLAVGVLFTSTFIAACRPASPSPTPPPQPIRSLATPTLVAIAEATLTSVPTVATSPTVTPTWTVMPPTASPTPCKPPANWVAYTVRSGDTLFSLAAKVKLTQENVMRANCLAAPNLTVGQTVYLPSIPCTPTQPAGWSSYTVRAGDTLFSLAATRSTTANRVIQVNCLSSSIRAGQSLYLPPLPFSPQPPPVATKACSAFSCGGGTGLPDLTLASGGPNDPTFPPCQTPQATPWIDTPLPSRMEVGTRRYFYACDFASTPNAARVTLRDGSTRSVTLYAAPPNPDLQRGNSQAVVEWPALPVNATGLYTLTVTDAAGNSAVMPFLVLTPTMEHILAIPPSGSPGTTFQVYYTYFDLNSRPTFDFYGENQPVVGADHKLSHRSQWRIAITQPLAGIAGKGWAVAALASLRTDRRAAYAIGYDNRRVVSLFWLR